jgi:MFS family permease
LKNKYQLLFGDNIIKSLEVPKESRINFLVNLATLSVITFIPLWGKEINLNNQEIALAATVYALIAFLTSILVGRLSDILATRKFFVVAGSIIGAITLLGLLIPDKLFFMIFRAAAGLGFGMLIPSLVALVSDKQNKIGSFSSFGSIGWALGVIISGILGLFWLPSIFIFGVLALIGASVIAFTLEEDYPSSSKLVEDSFVKIFWERKSAYLSLGIRHSFANAIWTFWALFLVDLGADTFWIAIIQFMNAFTQFIIMQKYTDKLKSQTMITLGLLLSSLSFFIFTIPSNFWGIIPTQIVLGLSWAFLYVGTLRYSMEKTAYDKSTSAGILTSTTAISGIFGAMIALIIISLGGSYVDIMYIAALATFLTLVGFIVNNYSKNIHSS